jgi:hypothetical protein
MSYLPWFSVVSTGCVLVKCLRCGLVFDRVTNNQKYCSDCSYIIHLEYMRGYMVRRRNLGTSDFFHKRNKNMENERLECLKEIHKLGFKRQFT